MIALCPCGHGIRQQPDGTWRQVNGGTPRAGHEHRPETEQERVARECREAADTTGTPAQHHLRYPGSVRRTVQSNRERVSGVAPDLRGLPPFSLQPDEHGGPPFYDLDAEGYRGVRRPRKIPEELPWRMQIPDLW